jgi:intracellular multiplication protein IcmV
MAIKDIVKINRKTFFNPRAWVDFDNLKYISNGIWGTVRPLFVAPQEPLIKETFEQAMLRMNLSEKEVIQKQENYLFFTYIFLLCAVVVFAYSFYLLMFHHSILGFCLGIAVVAMFLSQAMRFHFWYFQTKHRKLGCTLSEWWEGKLTNEQGPTV